MTAVLAIAALVVAVDQATKVLVLDRLVPGVPVPVIEGFLSFTLVMNPGLAFGLLAGLPPPWRWLVAGLSVVALLVLARVAMRLLDEGGWLETAAVGLVFGGAVGNLIDRARFGAVVDFIDVYYGSFHWWAFNVADAAITVGVALLVLHLVVTPSARPPGRP
ncbi:MAG TPA: signal peptidase II [Candidatus Binatia bacterium]|nr:signal peptidase II [Candidatus Binatia bacterium]